MAPKHKSRWLTGLIALALGLGAAGAAQGADKVRLRLNWMYYGSHAGFALGKDKGYYADAGIDLDIRSGNGSGSAHRLVANGDSTFSYGSCASMINLVAQGADLVSVAVIDAMGTEAVLVRPDAGVKSITDLKGKSILTTANAGVNTFFPLVLKTAGLSPADVKIINVPEGALVSGFIQAVWTTSRRRSRRRADPLRPRSPTPISASTRSATASSRRARPSMAIPTW